MNRYFSILFSCALAVFIFAASCSKPPGRAEYDRALHELKRNNNVRARALLEKSITLRPGSDENAPAYNYLGVTLWRLGQYQAAQEAFEDSRRLSPTLAEPVYNLALLYQQMGNATRAVQLLEEAARTDESDTRALEYLAQLYIANQQWPEARRVLHTALNRAPNSAHILTALGVVDLNTVGAEKSIESQLIALEKDSHYAPALFNIGLVYLTRLQDPTRANSYFKRYLAQNPTGPNADFAHAAMSAPSGPHPEAPPSSPLAPALPSAASSTTITPTQQDDTLIEQAAARAERGDATGALDQLLRAATEAGRAKRADAQEKFLRASTKIAFEEPRGYLALGDFLMERQQADAALRAYKRAAALDAQSFHAQYGLARAALKTGETDAALVGLTTAVRLNPQSVDALWDLARVLDHQVQSPERAIAAYRDVEKLFPGDPRVRQIPERIKALTPAARAAAAAAAPRPKPAPAPAPQPQPAPSSFPSQFSAPAPRAQQRADAPQPRAAAAPIAPRMSEQPKPLPQLGIQPSGRRNTPAATEAFNRGTALLAERRWEQAIASFTRAVENDDRFVSAYYNLGLAYAGAGDYEMAKAAYARSLALQPDLQSARYNLALLYFQTRNPTTAAALAQEIVQQKPDYAVAHYLLGQIYSERAETIPQARAAYSRFLELAPTHPSSAVVRQWLATH